MIIGKPGKYVSETRAREHVAGYCVVNDVSERNYQLERGGQWDKGKCCDTFAPIGPWLVTLTKFGIRKTWICGSKSMASDTRAVTPTQWFLVLLTSFRTSSHFMSLQSGDIISTGTPPGVGHGKKPPVYLRAGQAMRLGIAGLGEQTQKTVQATTG